MGETAAERDRSGTWLHRSTAVMLVGLLAAIGIGVWGARTVVHDQNVRLLKERTNEVALVFNAAISPISTSMSALGDLARDGGLSLFRQQASELAKAGGGQVGFGLLRPVSGGYLVIAAAGSGLTAGETVSGESASALASAQRASRLVATPVMGSGAHRSVGFAIAGPGFPPDTVVYRLNSLGPVSPPSQAGTAPFHELHVVLYAAPTPDPNQVLVATAGSDHGKVQYVRIAAGATPWLLGASAAQPLVGSVAAAAPWLVLVIGIIGAVLVAVVVEQAVRRRDAAVALYRGERELAEALQRRLLPTLPDLAGLDVASRYIAASTGQAVGGDWFDAFDLLDGRAAVVIGDVIGHDIEAAAAMSQVRAALRAYAWEGGEPADVIERLAGLVDAFRLAGLVTVVYGVLGQPDHDGARPFRWANAGHVPPLLRLPDGQVVELDGGSSRVIGAPAQDHRAQGEYLIPQGSTLVLYTDGLVELPGISIADSVQRLRRALQVQDVGKAAEEVCESILNAQPTSRSRDDIAIVVARIIGEQVPEDERVPAAADLEPSAPA